MINCPACGAEVAEKPTGFNMPREAACFADLGTSREGCPYSPLIDKCRGPWVLEVFKPLPPDEVAAVREYLDD